eukprot:NODE_10150_length_607_cov_118.712810_g9876_i0.p2 GENE.NODE_10150_length_607_cov_118.712810_g9876_i0~~NODE_10150_length_607_cov_118.712810_g9876_i0.p2  ORF type:complete len:154 (-),score=59.29 NODE_10150_length_607_cov_118.712810_g9876_i0:146-550(-)
MNSFFVICVLALAATTMAWQVAPPSASKADAKEVAAIREDMPVTARVGVVSTLAASAEFSLESHNANKWVYSKMIHALNSACFLTYTESNTPAGRSASTGCEILYNAADTMWYLYAKSGSSTDTWCKARCLQWS